MTSKKLSILREAWLRKRDEVASLDEEVVNMLEIFHNDEGSDMVSYHELSKLQFEVPYYINEKVYFIRKPSKHPNQLFFVTHMGAGGVFGKQRHDVLEVCNIIQGRLIEQTQEDKIYHVGDTVTYGPYTIHKPYTDIDSIYHVIFKNNKTNTTPGKTYETQ